MLRAKKPAEPPVKRDAAYTCCNAFFQLLHVKSLDPESDDGALIVLVQITQRAMGCPIRGVLVHVKNRRVVELMDLPFAGAPIRLSRRKCQWRCLGPACPTAT